MDISVSRSGPLVHALRSWVSVAGDWVHGVFGVKGFEVLVEAEFAVEDDVEELLVGPDAAGQCGVEQHADASANELVVRLLLTGHRCRPSRG